MSKSKINFKNKDIKDIISTAIINRVLTFEYDKLTSEQIALLIKKTDINRISDDLMCVCTEIHHLVDWSRFDKFKLIRMVARNKNIIKHADLKVHNYSIKELLPCLKIHPDLIYEFGFKTDEFTKNDIVELLKTGRDYFLTNLKFNPELFTSTEAFLIARSFDFSESIMDSLKIFERDLNPQYIREIILKTGYEFIDKLNLSKLEPVDWIAILTINKDMVDRCNHDIFLRGDVYFLLEFVILFPQYKYLINSENSKEITSLGWEKLLIKFGEDIIELCDFSIINEVSWNKIKLERPNLMVYKL